MAGMTVNEEDQSCGLGLAGRMFAKVLGVWIGIERREREYDEVVDELQSEYTGKQGVAGVIQEPDGL